MQELREPALNTSTSHEEPHWRKPEQEPTLARITSASKLTLHGWHVWVTLDVDTVVVSVVADMEEVCVCEIFAVQYPHFRSQ
jgi:hypothetical protein